MTGKIVFVKWKQCFFTKEVLMCVELFIYINLVSISSNWQICDALWGWADVYGVIKERFLGCHPLSRPIWKP